jgi:WD40 repeat protein
VDDLKVHGNKLSATYETFLSSRATVLVADFARECLKQRETINHRDYASHFSRNPAPITDSDKMRSSSETSEDCAELSEDISVRPTAVVAKGREYSSSPATSFSTDHEMRKDIAPERDTISTPQTSEGAQLAQKAKGLGANHEMKKRNPAKRLPVLQRNIPTPSNMGDTMIRPYLSVDERERRARKLRHRYHNSDHYVARDIDHFDFIREEIEQICISIRSALMRYHPTSSLDPLEQLSSFMAGRSKAEVARFSKLICEKVQSPGAELGCKLLHHRGEDAIAEFLGDAADGKLTNTKASFTRSSHSNYALARYLRGREMSGIAPLSSQSGRPTLRSQAMSCLEDSLTRQSEWTDCCGDIATITWIGNDSFVCGATAHSDNFNMQYNRAGNLIFGSLSSNEMRAVPGHRIPRPLVAIAENAQNASNAMRETQDRWLYTSVVSTSFSEKNGLTFTASFDKTVKAWRVADDESSAQLQGVWEHDNNVNFVVTSRKHNRVATASDVGDNAIRVYDLDLNDVSLSPYDTYTGERAKEQACELRERDNWAYFPATIGWGKCESTKNLLLVGYSPRSLRNEDTDIPEDRRNTGELCLWDVVNNGGRIQVPSARSQNVFEVLWHPSQPCFIAATSPGGAYDPSTRTQIRIFAQSPDHIYHHFVQTKTLDCSASDINELTMMPNSPSSSFVTASCTDGSTYVYDTAQGDKAIHVLNHGESLDNPLPDIPREVGDQGVKFASWGQSSDRFYTGSTDGKVKAWDIRAPVGKAFIRNVLEVSGGISAGSFSKDYSKLLIGDATGKVHLLRYDDSELLPEVESTTFPGLNVGTRATGSVSRRPKPIIQHNEANDTTEESGIDLAKSFIEDGQLVKHPDPRIGVLQGPKYSNTRLFDLQSHEAHDSALPLKQEVLVKQQFVVMVPRPGFKVGRVLNISSSSTQIHAQNVLKDIALERLGIELDWDYVYKKEQSPRFSKIFREESSYLK